MITLVLVLRRCDENHLTYLHIYLWSLQAKFQEAQAQAQAAAAAAKSSPGTSKPPAKKPRRKPQPKAPLLQKVTKQVRKPANRKPVVPRSNKSKITKTQNNSLRTAGLDNSFSPDNSSDMLSPDISLSLSSDYGSASSPMSPAIDDYQQYKYESSLFGAQQRDEMLLGNLEHDESLDSDFPIVSNDSSKGLYPTKGQHSVPASVITHTPALINSGVMLGAIQGDAPSSDSRTKSSPLNSKSKGNKGSKSRDTKKLQDADLASLHTSILSPVIHRNNVKEANNKIKELALNKDPMFSPPHGLGSELKSHTNGVSSDHLHSPPMTMDAILSPTQRSWSAIVTNTSPAATFTSPLNSSQTGLSRLVSPPFSPTSMSPHISPHNTLGSVFTFDRASHFQQTSHMTSPTLSPASPSFLQAQVKHVGPPYQRHGDLDNSDDPFLFPVDRDQPLFGGAFNQNHDSSLGDLRLR